MKGAGGAGRWIRPEIRELAAYHVAEAGRYAKLDAMENPYPWPASLPPALVRQWQERLAELELNRYPDPAAPELVRGLRRYMAIPADAAVLLGNGSDELIQLLLMGVAGEGRRVLVPSPGFSMYAMISRFVGLPCHQVPLRPTDFSLDVDAMLEVIDREQPAVVLLAYPNNPTGNLFREQDVERILDAAPGLVVIDEAYYPFARASFMDRLRRWPDLLILRTVSKLGLAGLRLGMLVGSGDWLGEIDKIRLPYNISALTQATAAFALEHPATLDEQAERIRHDRDRLYRQLAARDQLEVWPSAANFLLLRCPSGRAGSIHRSLFRSGVLVKNLHGSHPLLHDCLRVTVGTPEENARFLEALDRALGGD
ncbi:MAG TPA: histidinol-phosphate transaminase [Gammaproteobacteria bacterium]|nr:histidinol-phosphate transaminase [Gammaproteobacteria bacterium]